MSSPRAILEALFAETIAEAGVLSDDYKARLVGYRDATRAVLEDLAAARITPEQAFKASEQARNAALSLVLQGAFDTRATAQAAFLRAISVALRVALGAA